MIDQDIKKEAYEPYFREKLHIFSLELIGISVLMLICAIFMKMMLPYFAAFIFIIEVVHYRIIILSIIEQKTNKYISDELKMIKISEIAIGEGKFGEDILYKFYPEKLAFGKYNIKCITDKEKKIRLRCAVSGNNWTIIHDNIEKNKGWKRKVTYGQYTKIIISYDDKDDEAHALTHRLNNVFSRDKKGERTKRQSSTGQASIQESKFLIEVKRSTLHNVLVGEGTILALAICIPMIIVILLKINILVSIGVGIVALIVCIPFCRHCLLLPIDLLLGSIEDCMMMSPHISEEPSILIKDLYLCNMHFHSKDRSIKLDFPADGYEKDNLNQQVYSKNREYEIKYYRLTKLLLKCEAVN